MNDYDINVLLLSTKYHNLDMTPDEADQFDIDRKFAQENFDLELDDDIIFESIVID